MNTLCIFQVCDYQLSSLRVHDQGQLVAVGNNMGTSYLVEFSENLAATQRNDKVLLTAVSKNPKW
jgi:dynein intermediate chain 2